MISYMHQVVCILTRACELKAVTSFSSQQVSDFWNISELRVFYDLFVFILYALLI